MKTITNIILCAAIFISTNCYARVTGEITGNLDQKVKILIGDKALTNLGKNSGVIKGDIFSIYKSSDTKFINPLSKCAVLDVYDTSSVCEIIKVNNNEIGKDTIVGEELLSTDAGLYPVIFQLLTKVVEPYEPHQEINVYVHSIFDDQNNVTEFSQKLQSEIKKVFAQKKRMKLIEPNMSKPMLVYLPSEYASSRNLIENYMKKDSIDVLISGNYSTKENKVELSLYKIDKNWEDLVVDTTLNTAAYVNATKNIVAPYIPMKKETALTCDMQYKPVYYKIVGREDRNNVIAIESNNNPFVEYNLKRTDFNIISPVDFRVLIDNNEVRFDKDANQFVPMTTGKHDIIAVFRKGYFFNDSLLFTSEDEISKRIVLILDNPGDIRMETTVNPIPGKENIDFKIYKKAGKLVPDYRPILLQRNGIYTVETFKD